MSKPTEFLWDKRFEKYWDVYIDWSENSGQMCLWVKDPDTNELVMHLLDIRVKDIKRNHGCQAKSLSKLGM